MNGRSTIIHMPALALQLGPDYDTQRTRRLVKRAGAAVKIGDRIVTTPRLLADHMPEVWNEIVLEYGDFRTL
jgi:hypothetical protein